MTLSNNIKIFEGLITAGLIGLAGFMWQLKGDIASIATTINNINDTMMEVKADVRTLSDRMTRAEVEIAGIKAEVSHKATKADLLELIKK